MTPAVSIVRVAQPPDAEKKFLEAVNARSELQKALEEQTTKLRAAEFELAEKFASEVRATPNLNIAEAAFQRHEAWRAADEKSRQQIDALQNILDQVNNHIEQLKLECSEAVNSVLNKKLETLKKALCEEEVSTQSIKSEIKNLEQEIKKSPSPAPKKS